MDIGYVNNSNTRIGNDSKSSRNSQAASASEQQPPKRTDSLELSQESRTLDPIEAKIASGYYDKPEVMRQIALKLSLQLPIESL